MRRLSQFTVVQLVLVIGGLFLALIIISSVWFIAKQWTDHCVAQAELARLSAASTTLELKKLDAARRGLTAGQLVGDSSYRAPREGARPEPLDELTEGSGAPLDMEPAMSAPTISAMQWQLDLAELISHLRGYGVAMTARPTSSPGDWIWIATTLAGCRRIFTAGEVALQRAATMNPWLLVALWPRFVRARAAFAQVTELVEHERHVADSARTTSATYVAAMTTASDLQSEVAQQTLVLLALRLRALDAATRRAAMLVAGASMLLLLASAWMLKAIVRLVHLDLASRRAMEHQLHQSQRMESIGQLTGGLAHDFNNLLGVIVGNLDLLEQHVRHDDRALARVRTAQRAVMRGSDLTRRLLAFARCQRLDPRPLSVNHLIGELLEMLPRTLGRQIEIVPDLQADLPDVTVDGPGLEGALLNLALNARDAMAGGGRISIATRLVRLDRTYPAVRAGEIDAGTYVRISVSDTGHGMSAETMRRVFEPFFTTKPRGQGTGLGLAMVYGFVKQSCGNIRLDSEVGVGATFTIDLPLGAPEASSGLAVSVASPRQTVRIGDVRPTVLIVDDEADLLEIAVTYCQEIGLHVLHAPDGLSALEIAVQQPRIDLLLTDVIMPGLNGVALAACLRPQYPELKVLYCSGFPSSALAERAPLYEDGPLVHKPYLKHVFVQAVVDALAGAV
jgi:signal transduction histidine kinase